MKVQHVKQVYVLVMSDSCITIKFQSAQRTLVSVAITVGPVAQHSAQHLLQCVLSRKHLCVKR
jgi:hypothetical protein